MAAGKEIPQPHSIRFGPFELDVRAAELRKHGIKIRLHDQPFRILLTLLDHPGEVVLREEIRLALWANHTIVEFDYSINAAIQRLRDALSDSADNPKYVETVARRGYRFIGAVERAQPRPAEETRTQASAPADPFQTMAEAKQHRAQPSIAVLPFANISTDKENEYFSDGLAEEILNLLTKIPGLKVIARTSSFAFRGKEQDIRKIAETLGVNHLLEGSVRRVGNRLRVTAQLIRAADGVWSERFDRDMSDIFAIQDEIGQAISEALQLRLAPRTRAVNLEAYQYYLKGQYHYWRLTPENYAKAKESFEQALAIEPNYVLAQSGLAGYHYGLGTSSIKPLAEVAPRRNPRRKRRWPLIQRMPTPTACWEL